jgi:3'-phosphoadenosine 5'-phosphosulfate sulfotransferase (PAPS reductase)/FAD synthetase
MYLLATERGIDFLPVFADTGNEHEITCEFVASLPDKVGGPAIRWVKADFSGQFEHKRRFIAEHWPRDLMAGTEGQWVLRTDVAVPTEEVWDTDCEELIEAPTVEPPDWAPSDPYMSAFTAWFRWVPGKRPMSERKAMERVERALALLHPTGIPFLDLCMLKGRFPSTRARFCSEELKHHPIFYQVQEPLLEAGHTVVSWQGVRAEESPRRAALSKLERLGGGLFNWRPILRWTVDDVFAIHRRHGVEPNPLYKMGCGRVGCMPCIHSRKEEIRNIASRFPEHVERIAEWERLVSDVSKRGLSTFFAANKTPGEHTRDFSLPMPNIHDVVGWSRTGRGGRQFDLAFLLDPPQCSSLYGLCE